MKYVLITFSLIVAGSLGDVPFMFLAVHGSISLTFLIIAGFLADILPDFFWYWLGMRLATGHLKKLSFFRKKPDRLDRVGKGLDRYGSLILFGSKFVWAFGIPSQIVAGMHRYPLKKAVVANTLGSACWIALLYIMAHIFTSSDIAKQHLETAESFILFAILALVIYFVLGHLFERFVGKND